MQTRSETHHLIPTNPSTKVSIFYRVYALLLVAYDNVMARFYHQHVPTAQELKSIDNERQAHWNDLQTDTGNELENHLRAYGYVTENGEIKLSDSSIYTAMTQDLKMSNAEAEMGAGVGISITTLNNINTSTFSIKKGIDGYVCPRDAVKLMHPSDTGFYEKGTGKFLKERFDTLKKYAVADPSGKLIISEQGFNDCMAQLIKDDHRWDSEDFIYKKLGEAGHKSEFVQLFSLIKKLGYLEINNVPHYALDDIEEFYRNTAKTMHRIRHGQVTFPVNASQSQNSGSHHTAAFFESTLHAGGCPALAAMKSSEENNSSHVVEKHVSPSI